MNTRVRTALQTMKAPASKHEKAKQRTEEIGKSIKGEKTQSLRCSSRERKMALQQDVDMLRKKLKHEENVHRALERAFTRPLGALPRLPPYLPPYTLELLAEVAVLEEEVVRLEEQVVNFRQRLYQEAAYISSSSSKKHMESRIDFCDHPLRTLKRSSSSEITTSDSSSIPRFLHSVMEEGDENSQFRRQSPLDATVSDQVGHSPNDQSANGKQPWSSRAGLAEIGSLKKLHLLEDGRCGQENQNRSLPKSTRRNSKQSAAQNHASRTRNHTERSSPAAMVEKQPNLSKLQLEYRAGHETAQQNFPVDALSIEKGESTGPNTISEEILKCLLSIFLKVSSPGMEKMSSTATEISRLTSSGTNSGSSGTFSCKMPPKDCYQEIAFLDPYGICSEFGERNIGPYMHLSEIGASTIDLNRVTNSVFLIRRLKFLLGKLSLVDLQGLSHQQKLAFWINIYNSCMMHAYLEYGIPDSPQMVVALMQKAIINVGGRSINALTIEHFILRLPYHSPAKYTDSRGMKNDEVTVRSVFGLDWPEPLVTFALSCGSWSSPAVRVYTACNVEKELDAAKRDYLQAAVRVSTDNNQLGIPKLLDWYLLDFAKDVESLLDWICLQLPTVAREEAVKCVERGRSQTFSQRTQIIPYDFSFRYLLDGS